MSSNIHHWNKSQLTDLENILSKFPEGGKVLDLGAGNGKTKSLFSEKWEWVGIDIEPVNEFVKSGDAHDLNFPNNHFDLVISVAVFEHLHSPWIAAKEVSRILKKGGYFFGTTAFLEPEHANSYFHMTRHGISHIIKKSNLEVISIVPTEGWTVLNSMKIFPLPGRRFVGRLKSRITLGLRRSLIKTRILLSSGEKKERAKLFLKDDKYRYAGSFRFLAFKSDQ